MKKGILFIGLAVFAMTSCGGPDNAEFEKAAGKICDCMKKADEKRAAEKAADTLGLNIDMTDLDYSLCALEVAFDVDPFDAKMTEAIGNKCPDLKETHKKYVDGAKK
jgi:hypothetical protein